MDRKSATELRRLDEAARAGWLYYVAGNTQDEISKKLGVSRQSAQRMVSLAVNEGLIKVRLDHPIAHCMQLSLRLKDRFRLNACEVVPSDPNNPSSPIGLAQAGAAEIERFLQAEAPATLAFGTGRALGACVDELPPMNCPQHRVVSLLGNIMADGSASSYDVIERMTDRVNAKQFPMPLPVLADSPKEKTILHSLTQVKKALEVVKSADVRFVGIGNLGDQSPLYNDGFITSKELKELQAAGGVGEIISWVYDKDGNIINGLTNKRVASVPLVTGGKRTVFGIAAGEVKVPAIIGALRGKLINALITNEHTAELILARD